jgi:hypothetical protein
MVRNGVHIDAIPVDYDSEAFLNRFLARWPEGSAAHASYFQRIRGGPDYSVAQAMPQSATRGGSSPVPGLTWRGG